MSKPFKPEVWEDYRPSGGDTVLVTGLFRFEVCPICGTLMYRDPYNSAVAIDEMKARPTVGAEWQSDYEHVCRTCYDEGRLTFTCAICGKARTTDQEQAHWGDPPEFVCSVCFETMTAKAWHEATDAIREKHRWDFE